MEVRTARGWSAAGYAYSIVVAAGLGYFLVGMPFQLGDNLGNFLIIQRHDFWGVFMEGIEPGYMRPMLLGTSKVFFDLSAGQYFLVFKTVHVAQILVLFVLFVRLLRVRTRQDFVVVPMAFTVLVGMHTFGLTVGEAHPVSHFMTILVLCLLVVNLGLASTRTWWTDASALGACALGLLTIESGLLVWVCIAATYVAGGRGVSRRALVIATALVAAYCLARLVVLPSAVPSLEAREAGFGMSRRSPSELVALFSDRSWMFYAYNVVCSAITVLLSEPRHGVWSITHGLLVGEVRAWQIINVTASVLTLIVLGRHLCTRTRRWRNGELDHHDRLFVIFVVVLLANAVIDFVYTKDVIMSPAGVFYAVAAYVATRGLLQSVASRPLSVGPSIAVAVLLLVMTASWSVRTVGLHVELRERAFQATTDWAFHDEFLATLRFTDPASLALVRDLREGVIHTPVPNPYFLARGIGRYDLFDTEY